MNKILEKTDKEKKKSERALLNEAQHSEQEEGRMMTRSKDKKGKKEKDDAKKLAYKRLGKHYLADEVRKSNKEAFLTAAAYHQTTRILVAGFSNGSFFLYEMPEVNLIHSLRYLRQYKLLNKSLLRLFFALCIRI